MANLLVFVILTTVAVIVADGDVCCSPDQWDGMVSLGSMSTRNTTEGAVFAGGWGTVSYDYRNKKLAINTTSTAGTYNVIEDYKKDMSYVISHCGTTCIKRPITHCMHQFCTPDNRTSTTRLFFGTGADNMSVDSIMSTADGLSIFDAVINSDCLPMSRMAVGSTEGVSVMEVISFFNITLGIQDPSVFTPPSSCSPEAPDIVSDPMINVFHAEC